MGEVVHVKGWKLPMEWMRILKTEEDEPINVRIENARAIGGGSSSGTMTVCPKEVLLKTKKPYVLNLMRIECVIGEWNKEKGEYGVRVYFASGNNQWFGGESAKEILRCFGGTEAVDKFNDRAKAGPPSV